MKAVLRRLLGTTLLGLAAAYPAHANDWGQLATVSGTLGINDGRLCMGEGSRGDLGCPTYAPSLTTAGDISVTGNLSANTFIGNGAGLTGVVAKSTDRIVSDTTTIIANDGMDSISFTTAGTERMMLSSAGYLGLNNSTPAAALSFANATGDKIHLWSGGATLRLGLGINNSEFQLYIPSNNHFSFNKGGDLQASGTNELLRIDAATGNVGISTTNPQTKLEVAGAISSTGISVTGIASATYFEGDGSRLTNVTAASSDRITSGTTNVIVHDNTGYVSFTSAGTTTGHYSPGGIFSAVGISTSTNQASFTTVYASGKIGIAKSNPSYPLDVTGDVGISGILYNTSTDARAIHTRFLSGASSGATTDGDLYMQYGKTYDVHIGNGATASDLFIPKGDLNVNSGKLLVKESTGLVGINTTVPSATAHVSGTFMVAGGTGSETCDANYVGLMRRDPTTGRLQTCR